MWKSISVALICVILTSCGEFKLAGGAIPPKGKTTQDVQIDTLMCKDDARNKANSAVNQTGDFLLGLTIVGAPLAFENDKQVQRGAFTNCMTAKGYTVIPVEEGSKKETQQSTAAQARPVIPHYQSQVESLNDLLDLKKKGIITNKEYYQKRKEILDSMSPDS